MEYLGILDETVPSDVHGWQHPSIKRLRYDVRAVRKIIVAKWMTTWRVMLTTDALSVAVLTFLRIVHSSGNL